MPTESSWIIGKREATAQHGMVTAMHPLAARAGADVLREGGNAVDAAVATAFAVGVVEPFMSGLGGVCCMVGYLAGTGETWTIDGSTTAPAESRPEMFELLGTDAVAGMYGWPLTRDDAQNTGYRSPCVPGTPAALLLALEQFGTLPRERILSPAIALADAGVDLDWYIASTIAFAGGRLRAFPSTMRTFFHQDGSPYPPFIGGETPDPLRQPELAQSLRAIAEGGASAFYRGDIAHSITTFLRDHGGIIQESDLAAYQPRLRHGGLESTYRGFKLVGVPETAGCVTAYQALNMLEQFELADLTPGSAEVYHLLAEAQRRAFLDRFQHLADPEFTAVPWKGLLSKDYARALAMEIQSSQATLGVDAGDPWKYDSIDPPTISATRSWGPDNSCTTHITVIDAQRNTVALTSTLGASFGSGVVVDGTGILLNNGMTWFDPVPGHVNSIAPGKRTLIAPTPTLVFREGRPWFALGAPGGRKIMSAVMQSIVNVIDFGMGIQDAVTFPRVHCEGETLLADVRIDPAVIASLRSLGHTVDLRDELFNASQFARPNGIMIDPETSMLTGGVNQYVSAWASGV
ncbi:MAG: gamma-glutamyltransferase [Chloroflexota bacterium]